MLNKIIKPLLRIRAALPYVPGAQRFAFRFNMRTLLLFVLGLAILCAAKAYARKQHVAIAALEKKGCSIYVRQPDSLNLEGIARLLLLEGSGEAVILYGPSSQITDNDLFYAEQLTHLSTINISDTSLTDAGLCHLQELPNLLELDISKTRVTDAGLAIIAHVSTLTSLSIIDTNITDNGLSNLSSLARLTYINLNGTRVTDEGMKYVEALSHLRAVVLLRTNVTPSGCYKLRKMLPQCEIAL